jgi:hypothetical protein
MMWVKLLVIAVRVVTFVTPHRGVCMRPGYASVLFTQKKMRWTPEVRRFHALRGFVCDSRRAEVVLDGVGRHFRVVPP